MNLVYVTATLPYGKGEAFFIPEIHRILAGGHRVALVPTHPRGPIVHKDADILQQITVTEGLASRRVLGSAIKEFIRNPLRVLRAAATLFAANRIRIFVKNLAVLPKGLWLAQLARRMKADHIHAQWGSCSSTMAMIASRVTGIPWSFTAHRWDIPEDNLLGVKVAHAEFVRAIDERGAKEIADLAGLKAGKVIVSHLGVRVDDRRTSSKSARNGRVLMAANLVEKKGHAYLLRTALLLKERNAPLVFELVGDGPLREKLERTVRAHKLDRYVTFSGQIAHNTLLERMRRGDWSIAVLPSIETEEGETEGIPVFLMEAMASGVPVIASSIGGIPELLRGGAGILVPQRDAVALATALNTMTCSADIREAYSLAGRRRIESEFDVTTQVGKLLEYFANSSPATQAAGETQSEVSAYSSSLHI